MAVLGGSFNPIHYGHLLLADDVCEQLALDRVLFVPAASPPHKPATLLAPAAHRFEMVRRAIADNPRFDVSDVELRRSGPSYTVDTLTALAADGDELFFVVGSETFLDLLTWREPRRFASLARLVVIPRAGSVFDTQGAAAQKVLHEIGVEGGFVHAGGAPPPPRGVLIVHATSLPLSASDLRRRVREGRSLTYRLPPAVVDYVRVHGLYRAESA
ncbi:MAG TPA: nicotinate-nucleotide adenylyltransferase [Methylomirabilota bacterium]|nr:nicotinate-nucleotide adenylyltransferase [Methylomirabilota bacterium]